MGVVIDGNNGFRRWPLTGIPYMMVFGTTTEDLQWYIDQFNHRVGQNIFVRANGQADYVFFKILQEASNSYMGKKGGPQAPARAEEHAGPFFPRGSSLHREGSNPSPSLRLTR
jgi:hypothetical protein